MPMRTPTHLLAAVATIVMATTAVSAQTRSPWDERAATSSLTAGLGFAGGASITLDAPESWKVAPVFGAWRGDIDITYPLTPVISASLNFGIDQRAMRVEWHQEKTMYDERYVHYFHITPGFTFSAFYLGMSFGIPTGGIRRWQDFSDVPEKETELDPDRNELATMIEPRIGAVVPLMDEDIGWLGLTIGAGYNLSNISDDPVFLPGSAKGQEAGSQTVSLHLGVTWQFAIPGTSRRPADL